MNTASTYVLPSLEYHLNITEKPPMSTISGLKTSRKSKNSSLPPHIRNNTINPFQSEKLVKDRSLKIKRLDVETFISSSADCILFPSQQKQNKISNSNYNTPRNRPKEELSLKEASEKYKSSFNDIRSLRGSGTSSPERSPERSPRKSRKTTKGARHQGEESRKLPEFLGASSRKSPVSPSYKSSNSHYAASTRSLTTLLDSRSLVIRCLDCECQLPEPEKPDTGSSQKSDQKQRSEAFSVCFECLEKRKSRKNAIVSFIQSEIAFGEDIRAISRDISDKLIKFGLITDEENESVFCNLTDVIKENAAFLSLIREQVWQAAQNGDTNYANIHLGKTFLRSVTLLKCLSFYSTNVAQAGKRMEKICDQKQNVSIFLDKCFEDFPKMQTDGSHDFTACLSIPSKRLKEYPFILEKIRLLTSPNNPDYSYLGLACSKIKEILSTTELKNGSVIEENSSAWSPRVNSGAKTAETMAIIDWPTIALREAKFLGEKIVLVMADYIGYDYESRSKTSGTKARKFVAMLVTASSKMTPPFLANEQPEIHLLILKQVSVDDFIKVKQLNLKVCMFRVNHEKQSMLEISNVESSEETKMKFPSFQIANEWLYQCKRLCNNISRWDKRRNAIAEVS